MTLKRRNLAANFAGTIWIAALALLFTPVYVHRLGVEAYGLVGFYTSLQAIFMLLDMGLGTTLNRELARLQGGPLRSDERTLVQTLETLYWTAGLVIIGLLCAAAPLIAGRWIHRQTLPLDTVRSALLLMGIAIGLNFPLSLYQGGLLGLMRHVRLNAVLVVFGTLRWGGAAAILVLRPPSIIEFFAWQAGVSAAQTLTLGAVLDHAVGAVPWVRRFSLASLAHLKSFAGGLAAVTLLGALLTHADKLIVSRFAPLEQFGYYALAATVASGLALMAMPFFMTAFPQFSALAAAGDEGALRRLYHRVSRLLAAIVMPAGVALALFAQEILEAWTRDAEVARQAAPFLSVLAIGFALHGLAYLPYALQLAHGWVSLSLRLNAIALVVLIPAAIIAVMRIGPLGAAGAWVVLNAMYVIVGASIMHTRILRGELWRWYAADLGLPLCGALLIGVAVRMMMG